MGTAKRQNRFVFLMTRRDERQKRGDDDGELVTINYGRREETEMIDELSGFQY